MTLPPPPFLTPYFPPRAGRLNVHDATHNDVAGPVRLIGNDLKVKDQLTHADKRTAVTK